MSAKNKLIKIVLPLLVIIAGFVAMRLMVLNRPEPKKTAPENPGALVEVTTAARGGSRWQGPAPSSPARRSA